MTPRYDDWLDGREARSLKGPVALILCEDAVEIGSTLRHHLEAGFRRVLALSPDPLDLPAMGITADAPVTNLIWNTRLADCHRGTVNALIDAVPEGTWVYYGFNAEYLFHPFSEHRRVGEMLAFHAEERRQAMLTYVIDLYAADLARHPDAVSLDETLFDRSGYFALGRQGPDGKLLERQLDFFGGLRWRFEEHVPENRRRIDRIALFRTAPGLRIGADHLFNVPEYNTHSCPWHHNLTATIASFRVAKALMLNPGSRGRIDDFRWHNSHRFTWSAQQLMDLGLMEPGQWF